MSRYNSVPVIVQQMVESIQNKATPEHVKFNQAQVLETIRDYCDAALVKWKKDATKSR